MRHIFRYPIYAAHAAALAALLPGAVFAQTADTSGAAQTAPAAPAASALLELPAHNSLLTRWAKDVDKNKPLPDYPRPQMVRSDWQSLNGQWDYAVSDKAAPVAPEAFAGQMTVPFPLESALSGVQKTIGPNSKLWYRRTFVVPEKWEGQRVLLHFGAVNYECEVRVNGVAVARHRGGYDGFDADITKTLKPGKNAAQEVTVSVINPLTQNQVRGKQTNKPGGIFYTPATGIWQTVWLEPVPDAAYLSRLKITPDLDKSGLATVQVGATTTLAKTDEPAAAYRIVALATDEKGKKLALKMHDGPHPDGPAAYEIPNPHLWTPETPYLYKLRVALVGPDNKEVDHVESYFALRKISLGKDDKGVTRIFLNNAPYFQAGVLDQGYWPDGIYTAPTDDALKFDIEAAKNLGFNMIRKHAKVEPERWYYYADKLGVLVWQDMPQAFNGETPDPTVQMQFNTELVNLVNGFYNHPSIVFWTLFNEGWGQHNTVDLTAYLQNLDPSRLVNSASGWTDKNVGDVHDIHKYPAPGSPDPEDARAAVLGEYGGLGLSVPEHRWENTAWGYQGLFTDGLQLTRRYAKYGKSVVDLRKSPGLSAMVYTQLTDVETESNGLLTYDRALYKPDVKIVAAANKGVFLPIPPDPNPPVLATSQDEPLKWSYTTDAPDGLSWTTPSFDAASWKTGDAGFGHDAGGVNTNWNTPDIWIRREFSVGDSLPKNLAFTSFHDEDVEIYINGVLAATASGYTTGYVTLPMNAEGRAALKSGRNVIAVHCHQTAGGQFIDVGIINADTDKK